MILKISALQIMVLGSKKKKKNPTTFQTSCLFHTHTQMHTHTVQISVCQKYSRVIQFYCCSCLLDYSSVTYGCRGVTKVTSVCTVLYVVVSVIALLSKCHFSLLLCMSVSLLISWGVCSGGLNYKCGRQKGIPKTQWSADTSRLVISCLSSTAAVDDHQVSRILTFYTGCLLGRIRSPLRDYCHGSISSNWRGKVMETENHPRIRV